MDRCYSLPGTMTYVHYYLQWNLRSWRLPSWIFIKLHLQNGVRYQFKILSANKKQPFSMSLNVDAPTCAILKIHHGGSCHIRNQDQHMVRILTTIWKMTQSLETKPRIKSFINRHRLSCKWQIKWYTRTAYSIAAVVNPAVWDTRNASSQCTEVFQRPLTGVRD